MQVKQSELVILLKCLDVDTADKWDVKKLREQVNKGGGIDRFVPASRPEDIDPNSEELLARIMEGQKNGESVEVEPDGVTRAVRVRKAPPRPKRGDYDRPRNWADWPAYKQQKYYEKHPLREPQKGKAFIIIRELRAAAGRKDRGVTKAFLLEILKAEYPDQDPLKMETNINNLVPTRLRKFYGIYVTVGAKDGAKVYWIDGDGKTPPGSQS